MTTNQRSERQWTRDVVTLTVGIALLTVSAFVLLRGMELNHPAASTSVIQVQVPVGE